MNCEIPLNYEWSDKISEFFIYLFFEQNNMLIVSFTLDLRYVCQK